MENIQQVTVQTVAGTQQTEHAAADLNRVTMALYELVEQNEGVEALGRGESLHAHECLPHPLVYGTVA